MMKDDDLKPADKLATALNFNQVLGLDLDAKDLVADFKKSSRIIPLSSIPKESKDLIKQREVARTEKNWPEADRLRIQIEKRGFQIEDGDKGPIITEA